LGRNDWEFGEAIGITLEEVDVEGFSLIATDELDVGIPDLHGHFVLNYKC